jgi:hypothetical protein
MMETLICGNDATGSVTVERDGNVIHSPYYGLVDIFSKRGSVTEYLPLQVGDSVTRHDKRRQVTEEDIRRGYMAISWYWTDRSSRLINPVFLRPVAFFERGSADRPSRFAMMEEER